MELEKEIDTPYGPVRFRPYTPADEAVVLDAWQAAFGKPMDPAIWRWKFHDNPYGRQMMMALNTEKEPIAMYNGIPVAGNWQGQAVRFTQLIDHFSHPAFRRPVGGRKGIFVLLAEHFFDCWGDGQEGSAWHYGFPGKKHFQLGALFLDYERVQPFAFFHFHPRKLTRWRWPGRDAWTPMHTFGEEFDQLWLEVQAHYPFSMVRDRRFVQWRFGDHPAQKYELLGWREKQGSLGAYIAYTREGAFARVIDYLGPPPSSASWRALGWYWQQQGIKDVAFWLPQGHFLTEFLHACGLKVQAEPLGVIPGGRSFAPLLSHRWVHDHLFFTQADLDLY